MMTVAIAALLLAQPFWETKPSSEWSREELARMLGDSPWARVLEPAAAKIGGAGVRVYVASAEPCRAAEREAARRVAAEGAEAGPDEEYEEFLRANQGRQIVLAIEVRGWPPRDLESEIARMEKECLLQVSGRKIRMSGSFPPTASDPWLRLAFPLELQPKDKDLMFELYVPGVPLPYRRAGFTLREMQFHGKPAW
jgi:hypothetical protein